MALPEPVTDTTALFRLDGRLALVTGGSRGKFRRDLVAVGDGFGNGGSRERCLAAFELLDDLGISMMVDITPVIRSFREG